MEREDFVGGFVGDKSTEHLDDSIWRRYGDYTECVLRYVFPEISMKIIKDLIESRDQAKNKTISKWEFAASKLADKPFEDSRDGVYPDYFIIERYDVRHKMSSDFILDFLVRFESGEFERQRFGQAFINVLRFEHNKDMHFSQLWNAGYDDALKLIMEECCENVCSDGELR